MRHAHEHALMLQVTLQNKASITGEAVIVRPESTVFTTRVHNTAQADRVSPQMFPVAALLY